MKYYRDFDMKISKKKGQRHLKTSITRKYVKYDFKAYWDNKYSWLH